MQNTARLVTLALAFVAPAVGGCSLWGLEPCGMLKSCP